MSVLQHEEGGEAQSKLFIIMLIIRDQAHTCVSIHTIEPLLDEIDPRMVATDPLRLAPIAAMPDMIVGLQLPQ